MLVGYLFLRLLVGSPFGRTLVGVRENEARMRSLGYSVTLYKVGAIVIAGGLAGFAGALTVQQQKYVDYTIFSFTNYSALAVIALIIGGRATLLGPVLGGAFVFILRDQLSSHFSQHWPIVLGAIFVLVVYLFPGGLMGGARTYAVGCFEPGRQSRSSRVRRLDELRAGSRARQGDEAVRSAGRSRRRLARTRAGCEARPDRPERRRQVDAVQRDRRDDQGNVGGGSSSPASM